MISPQILAAFLIFIIHTAPENPTPAYTVAVVEICASLYDIDADECRCIINRESEWNPNARGDGGEAVGLWQWHEESIRYAFDDMGIVWNWDDGDPRLDIWASTLAACHALSKGWDWWTTQETCEEILATAELE